MTIRLSRVARVVVAGALVPLWIGACSLVEGYETTEAKLSGRAPEALLLIDDDLENGRLDAFFPSYSRCGKLGQCGAHELIGEPGADNTIARLHGNFDLPMHSFPRGNSAATWRDYDFELRFRPDRDHPGSTATFGFRRHQLGTSVDYFGYLLEHTSGTWRLLKQTPANKAGALLVAQDHPPKVTRADLIFLDDWLIEWHDLRISIRTLNPNEALIEVYVDGALVLHYDDHDPAPHGAVELRLSGSPDAELWIDDVRVIEQTDARATWTQAGPMQGGWLSAVAVDPRDADVAYVAAWDGGLFKTIDGGNSWRLISVPHGMPKIRIRTVVLAPSNPDVIYVGSAMKHVSSLFRSDDGGDTWRWTQAGDLNVTRSLKWGHKPEADTWAIAVDPTNPMHVFVGIDYEGVYESHDGGETFELSPGCDPHWLSPAVFPSCWYKPAHSSGTGSVGAIAIDPKASSSLSGSLRSVSGKARAQ